jgi:hypothetical protein
LRDLDRELEPLVARLAPTLLKLCGCATLTAAKIVGETAGATTWILIGQGNVATGHLIRSRKQHPATTCKLSMNGADPWVTSEDFHGHPHSLMYQLM